MNINENKINKRKRTRGIPTIYLYLSYLFYYTISLVFINTYEYTKIDYLHIGLLSNCHDCTMGNDLPS